MKLSKLYFLPDKGLKTITFQNFMLNKRLLIYLKKNEMKLNECIKTASQSFAPYNLISRR